MSEENAGEVGAKRLAALPPPPWLAATPHRTRRVHRPPLDRDRIVAAGLRIVDTEGVEALSLRRLAKELDVAAMSVYWHVRDKAQLLDLIGEAVLGEMVVPENAGDWREQLRSIHRAMRDALERHPNATDLMIGRARYGPAGVTLFERILRVLLDLGLSPEAAADAYSSLYLFTLGYAATASRTPEFMQIQRDGVAYLQSLPAETFPSIRVVAPAIGSRTNADRFDIGLDVVLEGIAIRLAGEAGRRRP